MKHILVGFAALFVSLSTQAAYLLWQVDTTDYDTTKFDANKYVLYVIQNGATTGTVLDQTSSAGQANSIDITSYSTDSYSFYVELVNWEDGTDNRLAKSATVSYADLSGHIATTLIAQPSVGPWHAGSYSQVPEPSSAVLLMLGMGLLALKRRK